MRRYLYKLLRPHFYPLLGYILVTFVFLFPAFLHVNSGLWGFRGDNFFVVWVYWYRVFAFLHGLNPDYSNYFGYPFGENIRPISEEVVWTVPLQLLTLIFGPFIAFNLLNIVTFILAGFCAYLFVLYLTKNKFASFLAGMIFTLAPYHFWQSYTHLSLGITFWLPLYFLFLFKVWDRPNFRNGLKAGIIFMLTYYSSFYYGFFAFVVSLFFGLAVLIDRVIRLRKKFIDKDLIKASLGFGLLGILTVLPSFIAFKIGNKNYGAGADLIRKPLENLFGLSARPWDYLIPPINHPLFGALGERLYAKIRTFGEDYKFISAFLPERVLFLGWVTVAFSALGILNFFNSQKKRLVVMVTFLAVVCFLFSMPPVFYLSGFPIYFPSFFTYQFNHFARAYSRIGILLLLFLLPLFVWGYELLEKKWLNNVANLKFIKKPTIIFRNLVTFVLIIEFLNFPPYYFTDMRLPSHYRYLKEQKGDFAIVEYPKSFDISKDIIMQFEHGKRVFNMNSSNPYFPVFDKVDALVDPYAPMILDDFNVRYIVLHTVGDPHPIDETWWKRFAPKYPKPDKGEDKQLVFEGEKAVVYKINPNVKAKVVVLTSDPRLPPVSIPSGPNWEIDEVANLIFINMENDVKKVKVTFNVLEKDKIAYSLVNYETDLNTFFSVILEVGKDQLVIPINTLEPLHKLTLTDLKVEIVK